MSWFAQRNTSIPEIIAEICREDFKRCLWLTIVAPTCYILAGVFILCGNLLTILAVWRTKKLRTFQNLHIVSLAVADSICVFGLFGLSTMHMKHLVAVTVESQPLCLFVQGVWFTSSSASNASIVLIALDRYIFILLLFTYDKRVTSRVTGLAIIVSWMISIVVGIGVLFFNTHDQEEIATCYFVGSVLPSYQLAANTITFFSVFCVVVGLYGRIVTFAYQQQKQVIRGANILRYKMRNLRLFLTVCGLYFICWMPFHVYLCFYVATGVVASMSLFFLLGCLNLCINFIVYPCMNRDFRKAFACILCFCKNRN